MELKVSRWWEYYYVRYFVGTIIGSIILVYFTLKSETELAQILTKLFVFGSGSKFPWMVLFSGLAYCYIASAPILVLHSFRHSFYRIKSSKKQKWFEIFAALIFGFFSILFLTLVFLFDYYDIFLWNFFYILLIFLLQLFIIYIQIFKRNIYHEYSDLSRSRAQKNMAFKEYAESYRHLREHGNAFLIIVFEIVLGLFLFSIESTKELVIIIFLWCFPATTSWILGSYLESKHKDFLSNSWHDG